MSYSELTTMNFDIKVGGSINLRGTFLHTACSDCVTLTFTEDSPNQKYIGIVPAQQEEAVGPEGAGGVPGSGGVSEHASTC